jgi:hypothetical protein
VIAVVVVAVGSCDRRSTSSRTDHLNPWIHYAVYHKTPRPSAARHEA